MKYLLPLVATATLASAPALAAGNFTDNTGWYFGAEPGWSNYDLKRGDVDNAVRDAGSLSGVTVDSIDSRLRKNSFSGDVFAGYQFNPYVAVELGYLNLGNATARVSGAYTNGTTSTGTYDGRLKFRSQGAALSVLPMYPVGDNWDIFGRLGAYTGNTKLSENFTVIDSASGTSAGRDSISKTTTRFLWGAGVGYGLNRQASLRLEYDGIPKVGDRNRTGEADVNRVMLSAAYRF